MYSALPIWVLFILFMQLVNGTQFINITFLSILIAAAPSAAVLLTDTFPLTSIYTSRLLAEYAPLMSLFISTQFLLRWI